MILVLENDEPLRRLVCRVLQAQGHDVLAAAAGSEARRLAEENTGRVKLLVTDVLLPDLPGPEVARALAPSFPGLRVLYLSGYSADLLESQGRLEPGAPFLQKPFRPDQLVSAVAAALA